MSTFYLHQRGKSRDYEDLEGVDFPNLAAAIDDAVISARHLMAARVREGLAPDGSRFEITDERGTMLAVVPFQETISEDGSIEHLRKGWYRREVV